MIHLRWASRWLFTVLLGCALACQATAGDNDEAGVVEVSGPSALSAPTRAPVAVANIPSPVKTLPSESHASRRVDDSWREPDTLIEMLRPLATSGPTAQWATEVSRQVAALGPALRRGPDEGTAVLQRLAQLNHHANKLLASLPDRMPVRKLAQANYALARRLDVWQEVVRLGPPKPTLAPLPDVDPHKLSLCLAEIDSLTADSAMGDAWRKYLLVSALRDTSQRRSAEDDQAVRQVARDVLERLTQTPLSPSQQKFVASGPVAALRDELRHWAAEPVGVAAVLRDIETYERTGLPSDAHRLALHRQYLAVSPVEGRRRLADRIDAHWRNRSVRIAVTEELLNKLIPERNLEYAPVNDTVLRLPVHGESLMATEAAIRMWPDPNRVRMVFVVTGEIAAETTTRSGSVRVHNDSRTSYVARKPLEIDMDAIHLNWPADVNVENRSETRGVETPISGIPVFGQIADRVAKTQADLSKDAALREMKQKVAAQVQQRVDAEVRQRLAEAVDAMNQRVFNPLNSLSLDPQMISAETTEKRFVMQLRLAGEDQLGSHTPRPQAPEDSLASVQIHDSVINNGIQRLLLNGRTFSLPELSQHVAQRLNRPSAWEINPDYADVKITFADQDAVVVRCQDGSVDVTLSIAKLSRGSHKWKNFQIQASYKPEVQGRSARLVRDGVVRLPGAYRLGDQVVLRGIFTRALSKNNPWGLVPDRIVNEPKLAGAAITQFVIDDGWIGVALGPKRAAETNARRPHWGLW